MAITIPDHEYELCMELARPLYIALGLVNDLYSWEKERDAAAEEGQDSVFNAIWVIMNERGIGPSAPLSVASNQSESKATGSKEDAEGDLSHVFPHVEKKKSSL